MSSTNAKDELAELAALMANACDADGNDRYLEAWTTNLSDDDRKESEENLQRSLSEARSTLQKK